MITGTCSLRTFFCHVYFLCANSNEDCRFFGEFIALNVSGSFWVVRPNANCKIKVMHMQKMSCYASYYRAELFMYPWLLRQSSDSTENSSKFDTEVRKISNHDQNVLCLRILDGFVTLSIPLYLFLVVSQRLLVSLFSLMALKNSKPTRGMTSSMKWVRWHLKGKFHSSSWHIANIWAAFYRKLQHIRFFSSTIRAVLFSEI